MNALKECPWCGGNFDKGYDVPKSAKFRSSDPSYFCSRDCSWAFTYKFSLGMTITLFSLGIIFSVLYFALPSLFGGRFPLDTIIVVTAGFGVGFMSLLATNRIRMIRMKTPQYSRRGQRIDEPAIDDTPTEFRTY